MKNFWMRLIFIIFMFTSVATVLGSTVYVSAEYGVYMDKAGEESKWYYDEDTATITVTGKGEVFDRDTMGYDSYNKFRNVIKDTLHIEIRNGIETIGLHAFAGSELLKSISLPESLVNIEEFAFANCVNLIDIQIPQRVEYIGDGAFSGCGNVNVTVSSQSAHYKKLNGVLYNSDISELLLYSHDSNEIFVVPETVKKVHAGAFKYNENIISVSFGYEAEEIGSEAFRYCANLKNVKFPTKLKIIGDCAFSDSGILNAVIPEGVTEFNAAFKNCRNLESVHMANSVETIGYSSFDNCVSLNIIEFSDGLKKIENEAFYNCNSLDKVDFPKHLLEIGQRAFSGCDSLGVLNFKENVHTIGIEAFAGCSELSDVKLPDALKKINNGIFKGTKITHLEIPRATSDVSGLNGVSAVIYYGAHDIESYGVDSDNIYFKAVDGVIYNNVGTELVVYPKKKRDISFILPEGVQHIERGAFYSVENLNTVVLPDSLLEIKEGAFRDAKNLENVSFGKNLTEIGKWSFYQTPIKSVVLQDSVVTIGYGAFYECETLENVSLGDELVRIEEQAFFGCNSMTELKLSLKLETIGEKAFCGVEISELHIPDTVVKIGNFAFNGCKKLEYLDLGNISELGESVFAHCINLKKVEIGDNLAVVKSHAFYNCILIETLEFGSALTRIEEYAFGKCKNLKKVYLGGQTNIQYIGKSAFCDSELLEELYLGDTLEIVDACAFDTNNVIDKVYYESSKENWSKIIIHNGNNGLTGTEGKNHLMFDDVDYFPPVDNYTTPAKYYDELSGVYRSFDVNYSDNYFKESSYIYNHQLARASVKFAMTAYAAEKTASQYVCAKQLLNNLDFYDIDYNEWYTKEAERNSIAVIAGMKRIAYDDGNYTLIAVGVRGGGYKKEWSGNFNVGNNGNHEGFSTASEQVLNYVLEYIMDKNIKGNIKIWFSGFSRAGATVNLAAAHLDDYPSYFGDEVFLDTDDIFAYCFETPRGAWNPDNESGKYNNIFSIVNQNDIVPLVAMKNWGFDRFGVTKYLPNDVSNSEERYAVLEGEVMTNFSNKTGKTYDINKEAFYSYPLGTYSYLNDVTDTLADGIGSKEIYNRDYQELIEYIGEACGDEKLFHELFTNIGEELCDSGLLVESFAWVVVSNSSLPAKILTLKKAGLTPFDTLYLQAREAVLSGLEKTVDPVTGEGIRLSEDAVDKIVEVLLDVGIGNVMEFCNKGSAVLQAHQPLVCMYWLDAMNENDFAKETFREIIISGPVDVKVYNSKNKVVAEISNYELKKSANPSIRSYVYNGEKADLSYNMQRMGFALPDNGDYRIEIQGYDNGDIYFALREQNIVSGEAGKTTMFYESVIKGQKVVAEIYSTISGRTDYKVTKENLSVEAVKELWETNPVDVNVSTQGNGKVSEGGCYYSGDLVTLCAMPDENETFEGWYTCETESGDGTLYSSVNQNDGVLLSKEPVYTMLIEDSMNVKAKFSDNTCSVHILDTERNSIVKTYSVVKGGTLDIEPLDDKEWSSFEGFYIYNESTGFLSEVTPDTVFTEDVIVEAVFTSHFTYDVKCGMNFGAEITGYTGDKLHIEIPYSVDGLDVIAISESAVFDSSIQSIRIPDIVEYIPADVFENITSLEVIDVDKNNWFYACDDGVLYDKTFETLIFYPNGKKDEFYELPCETVYIESVKNPNLNKIAFYDGISEIYEDAFDCENLKTIYYGADEFFFENIIIGEGNEEIVEADKFYYYNGDNVSAYILENPYADGSLNVRLAVDYAIEECVTIVAVYTEDKKLVGLSKTIVKPSDTEVNITLDDGGQDLEGCMMKVYFWDGFNSLKPVSNSLEAYVNTIIY